MSFTAVSCRGSLKGERWDIYLIHHHHHFLSVTPAPKYDGLNSPHHSSYILWSTLSKYHLHSKPMQHDKMQNSFWGPFLRVVGIWGNDLASPCPSGKSSPLPPSRKCFKLSLASRFCLCEFLHPWNKPFSDMGSDPTQVLLTIRQILLDHKVPETFIRSHHQKDTHIEAAMRSTSEAFLPTTEFEGHK